MIVTLVACSDAMLGDDPAAGAPGEGQDIAIDEVIYDLVYDSDIAMLGAEGGTMPARKEGPSCASSFDLAFFRGIGELDQEPNSFVEMYFPSYAAGSRSLVPGLDEPLHYHWAPPQWRLNGTIRAAFGGTAELEAYDADRVSVRITDTTMCTIPFWGHLYPGMSEFTTYAETATDCDDLSEVTLEAVADPPGSFTQTTMSESVTSNVTATTAWRTETGDLLCR